MGKLSVILLLIGCSSNPVMLENPDIPSPGEITPGPIAGMEFAYMPSDTFLMGSSQSDPDAESDEYPGHIVIIAAPFEIMTIEVTQAMWEGVMGSNPSFFAGDDRPVEQISWIDCQEFVAAMNALDPGHGYRLPSEAEWEYSCRAGTITRNYWGDDPGYDLIGSYAWFSGNAAGETHPAARKAPNGWGLFDMSGNVWEWCEDTWHDDYTGAPSDGSAWLSPAGFYRVGRGGSWGYTAPFCRCANRGIFNTDYTCNYLGLRLVRSAR
jgi:formylglycine-generating enzyme required for sulfatase activity